jgi:HEAT repeat protein
MLEEAVGMKDLLVRRAAVYGLARIEDPSAGQRLQDLQISDSEWVVRAAAAEALECRNSTARRAPTAPTVFAELEWLTDSRSRTATTRATEVSAPALLTQVLKHGDVESRHAATYYARLLPTEGVIISTRSPC